MIAIPPHFASARQHPRAPVRRAAGTRHLLRAALAAALLASAPAAASAAQGGVSVTGDTAAPVSKAKGAAADTDTPTARPRSVSKLQLKRAQTLLRVTASGTHDVKTRTVVKRFQRLRGIATSGVVDLATYIQIKDAFALLETGGVGIEIVAEGATGGTSPTATTPAPELKLPANLAPITPQEREILETIAQCESKGDPTALSANGLYRGKYQFDRGTWKTVGGTGDPAAATAEEQDQRAAILLRQRGTAPWPTCGADL